MEKEERWRRPEKGKQSHTKNDKKKEISSLQKKAQRRQNEQPVQSKSDCDAKPIPKPSDMPAKARSELHHRFMEVVEEAEVVRSSDTNFTLAAELITKAMKLSQPIHDSSSFWCAYLYGIHADVLWSLSMSEHHSGNIPAGSQYLDLALAKFAAFHRSFSLRGDDVYRGGADQYDWQGEDPETPLWAVYVFLLKSYAAATGFKTVALMPVRMPEQGAWSAPEGKQVPLASPTALSMEVLRVIARGSQGRGQGQEEQKQEQISTALSGWARRVVATAIAQSMDFVTRPLDMPGKGPRKHVEVKADARAGGKSDELESICERLSEWYPIHACSWGDCSVQEDFHGQFAVCSRCRQVRYCCKEHQAKHWRGAHRKACVKNP